MWTAAGPTFQVAISALSPGDSVRVAGQDLAHVQQLCKLGTDAPPIVVHRPSMRVIDGMHRLQAAALSGRETIRARYFDGTADAAFLLGVRLNAIHGFPLTRVDRSTAALRILSTHPDWSDRAISALTGLSASTVSFLRRSNAQIVQSNTRVGRDGRRRPLSAADGRQRAGELLAARPNATLRDIAREAGVSIGTAQDVRKRLRGGQGPVAEVRRPAARPISASVEASGDRQSIPGSPVALVALRRDPSLRFSVTGRSLLRLLDASNLSTDTWQRLAGSVPTHCAGAVSALARTCSDMWLEFARTVDRQAAATLRREAAGAEVLVADKTRRAQAR